MPYHTGEEGGSNDDEHRLFRDKEEEYGSTLYVCNAPFGRNLLGELTPEQILHLFCQSSPSRGLRVVKENGALYLVNSKRKYFVQDGRRITECFKPEEKSPHDAVQLTKQKVGRDSPGSTAAMEGVSHGICPDFGRTVFAAMPTNGFGKHFLPNTLDYPFRGVSSSPVHCFYHQTDSTLAAITHRTHNHLRVGNRSKTDTLCAGRMYPVGSWRAHGHVYNAMCIIPQCVLMVERGTTLLETITLEKIACRATAETPFVLMDVMVHLINHAEGCSRKACGWEYQRDFVYMREPFDILQSLPDSILAPCAKAFFQKLVGNSNEADLRQAMHRALIICSPGLVRRFVPWVPLLRRLPAEVLDMISQKVPLTDDEDTRMRRLFRVFEDYF